MKIILLLFLLIFSITLVSAIDYDDCNIYGNCEAVETIDLSNTTIINLLGNASYVPYTGATSNVNLGIFNLTTTGTGIFNFMNPNDDITFFKGDDVGDTTNGKSLIIYRNANEYDSYGQIYVDSYGRMTFDSVGSTAAVRFMDAITSDGGISMPSYGSYKVQVKSGYTYDYMQLITSSSPTLSRSNLLVFTDNQYTGDYPKWTGWSKFRITSNKTRLTEYMDLYHNSSNGVIESNTGDVYVYPNLITTGNITSSQLNAGNGFTGTCINTTFVNGIATGCND